MEFTGKPPTWCQYPEVAVSGAAVSAGAALARASTSALSSSRRAFRPNRVTQLGSSQETMILDK